MQFKAQIKTPASVTIFGGSFNPLHMGHLEIIRALSADPRTDRVMVVPNRVSPFKSGGGFLPDAVRLEMLHNALAGWENTEISDLEIRLPTPSYTYRTLQVLSSALPGASLFLALGMDALTEFARWRHAAEILALAGLVIFNREGWPEEDHGPESWLRYLPAPWTTDGLLLEPEGLVTPQGRLLLRRLPHPIPGVSSREILAECTGEGVPPGAREVLTGYWKRNPAP